MFFFNFQVIDLGRNTGTEYFFVIHIYSGQYFAFFKFCEIRNSDHNILREICEIAKSKLPTIEHQTPIEYYFENPKICSIILITMLFLQNLYIN